MNELDPQSKKIITDIKERLSVGDMDSFWVIAYSSKNGACLVAGDGNVGHIHAAFVSALSNNPELYRSLTHAIADAKKPKRIEQLNKDGGENPDAEKISKQLSAVFHRNQMNSFIVFSYAEKMDSSFVDFYGKEDEIFDSICDAMSDNDDLFDLISDAVDQIKKERFLRNASVN